MSSLHLLPELGFNFNALEPVIDTKTMEIHHDKHHAAYVTNLNNALANYQDLQKKDLLDLISHLDVVPEAARMAVRNNGGGHYNHSLFWKWITPGGSKKPSSSLEKEISANFGNFDTFVEKFSQAGLTRFGSGWAWLAVDRSKKLTVYSTPNQDSPVMEGLTPLLGLDVWEHAYYLNYQNRRADYIKAFWSIVNWDYVAELYKAVK
jgi:superoxide dismutase, Fe-Mn family